MKKPAMILLVLLTWFTISTCKKGGNGKDQSSNSRPAVSISQSPVTVLLPNNCEQQFTITNNGAQGSTLNYTIKDNGALGGFLDFTNASGSLSAGASATIGVSVKSDFVNAQPSLIDASLVLNVYTPNASNYTKIPVPVNIKSTLSIEPLFIGTWSGKWTGVTGDSPAGGPGIMVGGTWTLDLKTVDTVNNTFTGSLTWIGTDGYWKTVTDSNGQVISAVSNTIPINKVIALDASNATFTSWMPPNGCKQSALLLKVFTLGYGGYGPVIEAVFDIGSKTVIFYPPAFWTYPSPDNASSGSMSGSKQ